MIVIVAIAGNAVENVVGIVLAAKGDADLAIWVVTGDGEATVFEGVALIAMYVTLAAFAWLD